MSESYWVHCRQEIFGFSHTHITLQYIVHILSRSCFAPTLLQFRANGTENERTIRCIWFAAVSGVLLRNHQEGTQAVFANWASGWMI